MTDRAQWIAAELADFRFYRSRADSIGMRTSRAMLVTLIATARTITELGHERPVAGWCGQTEADVAAYHVYFTRIEREILAISDDDLVRLAESYVANV